MRKGTLAGLYRRTLFPLIQIFWEAVFCWLLRTQAHVTSLQKPVMWHRDKLHMVHNITNLRQSSTRIVISVAAIKAFRIFSHDATQAYIQGGDKHTRQVFLVPEKKDMEHFRIAEEKIL